MSVTACDASTDCIITLSCEPVIEGSTNGQLRLAATCPYLLAGVRLHASWSRQRLIIAALQDALSLWAMAGA
jgi:hypothetical protein